MKCGHVRGLRCLSLLIVNTAKLYRPIVLNRYWSNAVTMMSFLIHCQERSRYVRTWYKIAYAAFFSNDLFEFFDQKSNFCNIKCSFFVNSAFIFWSLWAHPVMNVSIWCVALIRLYRNVKFLGVNIKKNKLIH